MSMIRAVQENNDVVVGSKVRYVKDLDLPDTFGFMITPS
jgi:hypothetical protein